MIITPVDRVFEVKKSDEYTFTDKQSRAINLPGKPYMAIRIQVVPDDNSKMGKIKTPTGEELQ